MNLASNLALAASLSLIGCLPSPDAVDDIGGEGGTVTEPPVGASQQEPLPTPFAIEGIYEGEQQWNLSELVTYRDDGGEAVAEATIEAIVGLTGLPSFLRDDAEGIVADLIGDEIASYADAALGQATILDDLASVLGTARVGTRLSIESFDGTTVTGEEQLTWMTLHHGDTATNGPLAAVIAPLGYDVVVADISGDVSPRRDALTLSSHGYVLRPDAIISVAGVEVLGFDTLEAALARIIDCDQLIAELTGPGGALSFSVVGYDVALSTQQLAPVCQDAKEEIVSYVLGTFEMNLGVATGGTLALIVDRGVVVAMRELDYAGEMTLLPIPLGFGVAYQSTRVQ